MKATLILWKVFDMTAGSLTPGFQHTLLGQIFNSRALRSGQKIWQEIFALTGAVAFLGVMAQISLPLWPVPVTGQTLALLLVGAAFGAKRAAAATSCYLLLGLAGLPLFSEFGSGLAAVARPSFGYIIGFIPAAWLMGKLCERRWDRRPWLALAGFGLVSLIPFLTGIPYLWAVLSSAGIEMDLAKALALGFTPFILGGIIKAGLATLLMPLAWRLAKNKGLHA